MELQRRASRIDQLNRAVAFAAIGNCVLCKGRPRSLLFITSSRRMGVPGRAADKRRAQIADRGATVRYELLHGRAMRI